MAPNHHVAPAVAEILNTFAAQTPYKVDDFEEPIEVYGWPEPEICIWCGKPGCERCEARYDASEDRKHE